MSGPYPHTPGHQDTDTSIAAAESVKPLVTGLRGRVLKALADNPATADECAAELGKSVLSIRPRLTELSAMGSIVDTGERRPNLSGRSAIVWKVAA